MNTVVYKRSITVTADLYETAQRIAAENNLPLSVWAENIVRAHLNMPPVEPVARKGRKLAPKPEPNESKAILQERIERRAEERRTKAYRPTIPKETPVDEAYQRRAYDNPCRLDKCSITHVHPAHEEIDDEA